MAVGNGGNKVGRIVKGTVGNNVEVLWWWVI